MKFIQHKVNNFFASLRINNPILLKKFQAYPPRQNFRYGPELCLPFLFLTDDQ